ncbi:fucolectin-like [Danio aesculapii]|uniref:fucolectin-like n=1 Tax=Danio aesculapii TaxID=1142201 RepID=UPI0024C065BB|nr:fucolectin-like [Danio aesculapii]
MVGRYVFVHVPGYMAILTLCELEIYGDLIDNQASVGAATQSSTSKNWSADRAIDGDRGLQRINKGCSSTLNETSPWLRVDLLYFYAINRVVITNRNDSNAGQITGLEIHIGSSLENNGNNNPICAVVPGIPVGESYNYTCNGMIGRYINLIIPGDLQMLTLCEVEVFGKGPVFGRSFVRMHFSSTMDLTDQTMSNNILQQAYTAVSANDIY